MKKYILLFLVFVALFTAANAQTFDMPPGTTSTCAGTFRDDGGNNNYGYDKTLTTTLCPTNTATSNICLHFTAFNLDLGDGILSTNDVLSIFDGTSIAAPLLGSNSGTSLLNTYSTPSPTNTTGCLTFQFKSDGSFLIPSTAAGWSADISCVLKPGVVTAAITDNSTVYICPAAATVPGNTTINVNGSPSTATSPSVVDGYTWSWGDGTPNGSGVTASHTYPGTGGYYTINLTADDNNTGCGNGIGVKSTNFAQKGIYVLRPPTFTTSPVATQSICKGVCATLNVGVQSSTTQEIKQQPVVSPTFLPDGTGTFYTSTINFYQFPTGATVSAGCLPTSIDLNLSHSYPNDLKIDIIAPDGKTVVLFNRIPSGTLTNNAFLAQFGTCNPSSSTGSTCTNQVGIGAVYSIVNGTAAQTLDQAANTAGGGPSRTIWNSSGGAGCNCTGTPNAAAFPAGAYNSANNFNGLIGAPLNGNWTIRVTDLQAVDYGYLYDWKLNFPSSCYGLHDATPDLVTNTWTPAAGNPAVVSLTGSPVVNNVFVPTSTGGSGNDGSANTDNPNTPIQNDPTGTKYTNNQCPTFTVPGSYSFDFVSTDDKGCQYKKTSVVKVYDMPSFTHSITCTANNFVVSLVAAAAIDNSNFTGADIGTWQYTIDGGAATIISGTTANTPNLSFGTHMIVLTNSANTACAQTIFVTCPVSTLPITLNNFNVKLQPDRTGLLKWSTSQEENSDRFVVEKSMEGTNWKEIGNVPAAGYSNTIQDYSFIDPSLLSGINYYRVREITVSGRFDHSVVRSLKVGKGQAAFSISPNPARSSVNIVADIPLDENTSVRVLNNIGQLVKTISFNKGDQQLTLDLKGFAKGTYTVIIKNSQFSEHRKLIVQ